jgi:NADH-quinone oxidoreductase subunit L
MIALSETLGFIALSTPFTALLLLAALVLFAPDLPERRVHQIVATGLSTALLATLGVAILQLLGAPPAEIAVGSVLAVRGYHLDLTFLLDGPGVLLLTLDLLLTGLVGLYSARYMHREPGYQRFYVLLLLFAVGVSLIAAARGLDVLFAGWELVGLSSALLIALFHQRAGPVAHGLRAYAVYRTTDVGMLLGVVLLHHELGTTELPHLGGALEPSPALWLIGALLIFGAMGKGASVPFTGWLPRAMEGPTPSSAIFYGALSIHASPFLLLRIQPLLDTHLALRGAVVAIGLVTAVHASWVGRTQTDIKNALAYASVAQVALIWIEAGLGLQTLAMVHIAGHAALRTSQFLRAPSVLQERRARMTLTGRSPNPTGRHFEAILPQWLQRRLYVLGLERWYLDELLEGLVASVLRPLRALDQLDQSLGASLDGAERPEAQRLEEVVSP